VVVAVPSTPAQYFHLLLRQALRERKKPLVVATPKSPLRAKDVRSAAAEFGSGRWQAVLDDVKRPSDVKRVCWARGSSSGTCGDPERRKTRRWRWCALAGVPVP
jgi:2-oxoglutarate dehydrogenase E1 component